MSTNKPKPLYEPEMFVLTPYGGAGTQVAVLVRPHNGTSTGNGRWSTWWMRKWSDVSRRWTKTQVLGHIIEIAPDNARTRRAVEAWERMNKENP